MIASEGGPDLPLLIEDVAWHQRRAARALIAAWFLLVLGAPSMIRLVVAIRATLLDPQGEDPAGPLDALVLAGGLFAEAAAIALFRLAARRRRVAATLASRQIFDADGRRVAASTLRGPVASMSRLRRWAQRTSATIVATASLPDPERRAQLLLAARRRPGTRQERAERFGESIAVDYERALTLRRTVAALISVAIVCVGAVALIGYLGDRGASGPYQVGRLVFVVLPVLIPFVGIALRRSRLGFGPIVDRMMPVLRRRDDRVDRRDALAMLVMPRLHELWVEQHPLLSERRSADGDGAAPSR